MPALPTVSRGHAPRDGLVVPVPIDAAGRTGPTPSAARGPRWRRTSRGLYVPATVERTVEQRIVEAAAVMPGCAAITGWAALRWLGGHWFDGRDRRGGELPVVMACAAQNITPQPGFRVCKERLNPHDVVQVDGLAVVVPARAAFFEMRYAANHVDAVVAMDMAAFSDLVSLEEEAAYIAAHPGWTGVPQAREALPWCEENSWSPYETRLRLTWRQAGLAPPLCNPPVFDLEGRYVGTPDLLDVARGHIGQYEGAVHLAVGQRASDVRRDERYRAVGLETTAVYSVDLAAPYRLIPRLRAADARASLATGPRRWTIRPPAWWEPATTVAQRRALSGRAREVALRHREPSAS